jgi:hypothetical protein
MERYDYFRKAEVHRFYIQGNCHSWVKSYCDQEPGWRRGREGRGRCPETTNAFVWKAKQSTDVASRPLFTSLPRITPPPAHA